MTFLESAAEAESKPAETCDCSLVCRFVVWRTAVYGQDFWSWEEISSEVREGKKKRRRRRGVLQRQSHVRRAKCDFQTCAPFRRSVIRLDPLSAAHKASAGLLWCLGSLKALLLENVPNERTEGRQGYVEESGRGWPTFQQLPLAGFSLFANPQQLID